MKHVEDPKDYYASADPFVDGQSKGHLRSDSDAEEEVRRPMRRVVFALAVQMALLSLGVAVWALRR